MKKKLSLFLVLVLLVSVFAGCSGKGTDSDVDGNVDGGGEKKTKIAFLTDPVGTQVFLSNMVDALKDKEDEYNYETIVVECPDTASFEENARALMLEDVDFVIGSDWQAADAIEMLADEYPDKADYAIIDTVIDKDNVKSISFREQEGAYLIGVMAAMVTEEDDNLFGQVCVSQGPGSFKWRYGFAEGVKSLKPDAKFIFNYIGDYNDPAKAKEFAIQQYKQGASFINAAAAGGDQGVFEAALENGFYTSGQDVDLTTPDNPYIVSCQIKDTYNTLSYLIDKYFSDDWNTDNEVWGLSDGTIGAVHITHESDSPISDKLTEEDIKELKQVAEDIKSGKIDLTDMPNEEDYDM